MEPTESTQLLYGVRNQIIDAITELAIAESWSCGDSHVHPFTVDEVTDMVKEEHQNSDVERLPIEKVFGHDFSNEFAVGPSRALLEAYAIVEESFRDR